MRWNRSRPRHANRPPIGAVGGTVRTSASVALVSALVIAAAVGMMLPDTTSTTFAAGVQHAIRPPSTGRSSAPLVGEQRAAPPLAPIPAPPAREPVVVVHELAAPAVGSTTGRPSAADVSGLLRAGIPVIALEAYERAADREATVRPGCGIGWWLLAGIGRVESDHGRFGGARLYADGTSAPRIIGIALDGSRSARIGDTDRGVLDGDRVWDHAVGPMQFIPSTWRAYGVDASGDGKADPFNVFDAAAAAADYLCAAGGNLRTDTGVVRAIGAYNSDPAYLGMVLRAGSGYLRAAGGTVLPAFGPPPRPAQVAVALAAPRTVTPVSPAAPTGTSSMSSSTGTAGAGPASAPGGPSSGPLVTPGPTGSTGTSATPTCPTPGTSGSASGSTTAGPTPSASTSPPTALPTSSPTPSLTPTTTAPATASGSTSPSATPTSTLSATPTSGSPTPSCG